MKKKIILVLLSLFLGQAFAGNTLSTTKSTATLSPTCYMSVPNVDFGSYDPSAPSPTLANQTVVFQCTKGTAYSFVEKIGGAPNWTPNYSGYGPAGYMTNSSNNLFFQVYSPGGGRYGGWVDDLNYSSSTAIQGIATGGQDSFTVPFRIIPNQYVVTGNYSVTETAVITF